MHATLRSGLHALLAAALCAAPRVALACPVCTGGQKEEVNRAFLVGSLFLSVLPLIAAGTLVFWLRRRARAIEATAPRRIALPEPARGR
jgi:BioD-like phosphotransacetylase family protein